MHSDPPTIGSREEYAGPTVSRDRPPLACPLQVCVEVGVPLGGALPPNVRFLVAVRVLHFQKSPCRATITEIDATVIGEQ
jgi:hypothetical protein